MDPVDRPVRLFALIRDPLSLKEMSHWEFYVVPTSTINRLCGHNKTISIGRLRAFLQFVVHSSIGWKGPKGIQVWTTSPFWLVVHTHLHWNSLQVVLPWTMNCKNLPQGLSPFACFRDAEIRAFFSASRSVSQRNPAFRFCDAEIMADISVSRFAWARNAVGRRGWCGRWKKIAWTYRGFLREEVLIAITSGLML